MTTRATTTGRALNARMRDQQAFDALGLPCTHYAVIEAFHTLTRTGQHGSGGLLRDPVDALDDAEHVLAAVRAWARERQGGST